MLKDRTLLKSVSVKAKEKTKLVRKKQIFVGPFMFSLCYYLAQI